MNDNKDTLTGWTPRPGTKVIVNDVLVPSDVAVVYLQHNGIDAIRLTLPVVGNVWAQITERGVDQEDDDSVSAYYFDTLPIWEATP